MEQYDESQLTQLRAILPCISVATIGELSGRGLLHFGDDYWRFGDSSNGAIRKLYRNSRWKRDDNNGAAWHRLIGLDDVVANDRKYVLFAIEGSKDALAAAEIANAIDALPATGITCALGSGYRPIPSEMHKLAGRWVGVIGDNDKAGHETTEIVSNALHVAGVAHAVWNWSRLPRKLKDLYDLVAAYDGKQMPNPFVPKYNLGTFPPTPLPSQSSRVHGFTCSCNDPTCHGTHERGGISDEEKLGIVTQHIMTQPKTGNRKSFDLARSIKHMKLDMDDINEIFKLWFAKSRPLLPRDADEAESLSTFYRQLKRVRFTDTALEAAIERARKATPPFIAARDGDVQLAKLAALCRELQRNAGDRPFICPITVVVDFVPVRWRPQANYLLHVLEEERVIECVDRGAPHGHGKKGKPTFWRYRLPMD